MLTKGIEWNAGRKAALGIGSMLIQVRIKQNDKVAGKPE